MQKCIVNGVLSDAQKISCSVPQGVKVAACKVRLKIENAFNFQNLITEKGTQLALFASAVCSSCLEFEAMSTKISLSRIKQQRNAMCRCLRRNNPTSRRATLQIFEKAWGIIYDTNFKVINKVIRLSRVKTPLNSLPTSGVHNCVN